MGLAVYNSIILDLHFPSICYRKLLSPPVVPSVDSAAVGVTRDPSIADLAEIMPVSYADLKLNSTLPFWLNFLLGCCPWSPRTSQI